MSGSQLPPPEEVAGEWHGRRPSRGRPRLRRPADAARSPEVRRWAWSWLAAGLLVGVLWRAATPLAASRVDNYERLVAGEIVLAVLEVLAGLVVAGLVLARPGPGSAARLLGAVIGSAVASMVAWGTGRLLGETAVTMTAVLLLWPLTLVTVTVVVSLGATLMSRDDTRAL